MPWLAPGSDGWTPSSGRLPAGGPLKGAPKPESAGLLPARRARCTGIPACGEDQPDVAPPATSPPLTPGPDALPTEFGEAEGVESRGTDASPLARSPDAWPPSSGPLPADDPLKGAPKPEPAGPLPERRTRWTGIGPDALPAEFGEAEGLDSRGTDASPVPLGPDAWGPSSGRLPAGSPLKGAPKPERAGALPARRTRCTGIPACGEDEPDAEPPGTSPPLTPGPDALPTEFGEAEGFESRETDASPLARGPDAWPPSSGPLAAGDPLKGAPKPEPAGALPARRARCTGIAPPGEAEPAPAEAEPLGVPCPATLGPGALLAEFGRTEGLVSPRSGAFSVPRASDAWAPSSGRLPAGGPLNGAPKPERAGPLSARRTRCTGIPAPGEDEPAAAEAEPPGASPLTRGVPCPATPGRDALPAGFGEAEGLESRKPDCGPPSPPLAFTSRGAGASSLARGPGDPVPSSGRLPAGGPLKGAPKPERAGALPPRCARCTGIAAPAS
ncbi:hypothetical protein FHU30_007838 [Actinomadura rupiterrae]|nr:hypothetical protein [Actinomadura rupiterrae]